MSVRRIKNPMTVRMPTYQEEIEQEFRKVCTCIDELLVWAKVHAPAEIISKLELLKSYTVVDKGGEIN